jgi:hypothetical protein
MSDQLTFLRDAAILRDHFEQLPICPTDGPSSIIELARQYSGRAFRSMIERDGKRSWHIVAWHHLNGAERAIATRITIGNYQQEED